MHNLHIRVHTHFTQALQAELVFLREENSRLAHLAEEASAHAHASVAGVAVATAAAAAAGAAHPCSYPSHIV